MLLGNNIRQTTEKCHDVNESWMVDERGQDNRATSCPMLPTWHYEEGKTATTETRSCCQELGLRKRIIRTRWWDSGLTAIVPTFWRQRGDHQREVQGQSGQNNDCETEMHLKKNNNNEINKRHKSKKENVQWGKREQWRGGDQKSQKYMTYLYANIFMKPITI